MAWLAQATFTSNHTLSFPPRAVTTGRDADRVYMVKYSSGAEPLMFWMQDKGDAEDTENCNKVNEFANNPAAATAAATAALAAARAPVPGAPEVAGAGTVGSSDPASDALSSLLASLGLPPAPAAPGAAPAAAQPLTAEAFRSIMSGAGAAASSSGAVPAPAAAAPAPAAAAAAPPVQGESTPPIELQEVLSADAVLATGLLDDADTCATLIHQNQTVFGAPNRNRNARRHIHLQNTAWFDPHAGILDPVQIGDLLA